MKIKFLFYLLFYSFIHYSLEEDQNKKENLKKNFINSLSKKQENIQFDENKILNEIDSLVNNITEKYEKELINLTSRINNIINSSLETQNEIIQRTNSEKVMLNNMLNDIKLLKERYKQNITHTYIMGFIILIVFLIFCILDFIKKKYQLVPSGYRKAVDEQNSSNQISIE